MHRSKKNKKSDVFISFYNREALFKQIHCTGCVQGSDIIVWRGSRSLIRTNPSERPDG